MTQSIQQQKLRDRLNLVQMRIKHAATNVNRDPNSINLIAVTKYTSNDVIQDFIELGQHHLGENKPQQLAARAEAFPPTASWHMIGNLQRNKVQQVLKHAALIHAVDSLKLLERIEYIAKEQGLNPKILLEVNISGESTKHGFSVVELGELIPKLDQFHQFNVMGLMTMAPYVVDQESTRPVFRKLRELRDQYQQKVAAEHPLTELSMGMSNDFEVAIEEGATYIRLGSTLFEGLADS